MIETSIQKSLWKAKICVAGLGAIGTALSVRVAMCGHNVKIITQGTKYSKIVKSGVRLVHPDWDHTALFTDAKRERSAGKSDIIFLCGGSQDLLSLAALVGPDISETTIVVPVINGIPWWYFEGHEGRFAGRNVRAVDPGDKLRRVIPSRNVIGCVPKFIVEELEPRYARALKPLQMIVGEIDQENSARSLDLANLLASCGIATGVSDQIRVEVWKKVIADLMWDPLSVVARASMQTLCTTPLTKIARELFEEALEVALRLGVSIELFADKLVESGSRMRDAKPSMLQDFENGRPPDIRSVCGAVLELGDFINLPMPMTNYIMMQAKYKNANDNKHISCEIHIFLTE